MMRLLCHWGCQYFNSLEVYFLTDLLYISNCFYMSTSKVIIGMVTFKFQRQLANHGCKWGVFQVRG